MSLFVCLAFGFASPFLLWGLLLAGVPLLIQWLHRRKYVERVWAAMRFLRAATESQNRRLRMESLLLLCVRTLILLLVTFALAEPFLESSGLLRDQRIPMHTLLVFDASLSMQAETEGRRVDDAARSTARQFVESGQPGDSYQLLTIASPPQAVIQQPSFSPGDVLAEINRLSMSETAGNVADAISRISQLLGAAPDGARRRVIIISDFQQSNWQLDDVAVRQRTRVALTEISREASLALVPARTGELDNICVSEVRADAPLVSVGMPVTITAQVQSFATQSSERRIQLIEDGRVLQSQTIDLPSVGDLTVTFVHEWTDAGPHALQIHLEGDALEPDNNRWVIVNVKEKLSALLVNGRASGRSQTAATDFVKLALRPLLTADVDASFQQNTFWNIQPTVISEAELIRTDLRSFDCVFLCDVPFLSDDEAARLTEYVNSGGGLIIGMGDQVQLDAYGQRLNRDSVPLMPVRFAGLIGSTTGEENPFHFAEPQGEHPLLKPFLGNPRSGLTTANIYRYVETEIAPDSPVRVPLSYANGDAAIVEHSLGAGRVILVTTSLDDRWGSWALWPSFLPMMHELVEYVIRGQSLESLLVGQAASLRLAGTEMGEPLVPVRRPNGQSTMVRPMHADHHVEVVIDETTQSGVYEVMLGPAPDKRQLFAVNVDPIESNLRILTPDRLLADLFEGISVESTGAGRRVPGGAETQTSAGNFSRVLLLTVLVLLLVEQVMAWNGRYGLIVLVISPALIAGLAVWPGVSVAMGVLFAIVLLLVQWKPGLTKSRPFGR